MAYFWQGFLAFSTYIQNAIFCHFSGYNLHFCSLLSQNIELLLFNEKTFQIYGKILLVSYQTRTPQYCVTHVTIKSKSLLPWDFVSINKNFISYFNIYLSTKSTNEWFCFMLSVQIISITRCVTQLANMCRNAKKRIFSISRHW